MTPRRGARRRFLGHGVRQDARRRRPRRDHLGPPRAGGRGDPRAPDATPTTCPACGCPSGSPPPPTPARRSPAPTWSCSPCRRRRCAATSPTGPRVLDARRDAGLPDEGHRARHHQADERGDRGDRRGGRRTGSWWSPGPTWRPRSPPSSRPRPWWPAPTCDRATLVQHAITTPYFRPYTNDDVIGCELGGAVKNVIALAYGMATAMGLGDNTKATLITRGLAETARLGVALGADPLTFAGLAGLGDLVGTCSSPLSRNRTFGEHLGRGETLEQAQAATRQTAEGVKSCLAIRDLARAHGVEMPITEQVERVCHEGVDPRGRGEAADEPGDEAGMTDVRRRHPVRARRTARRPSRASRSCPVRCSPRRTTSIRRPDRPRRRTATAGRTTRPGGCWRRRSASWRAATASPSPAGRRRSPRCCWRVLRPGRHRGAAADGYFPVRAFADLDAARAGRRRHGARADRRAVPVVRRASGWCCWRRRPTRAWTSATWPTLADRRARRRRAGRGRQHHRDPARAAPARPRRRPRRRVRHQGADRPLRPAARLRGDPRRRTAGRG